MNLAKDKVDEKVQAGETMDKDGQHVTDYKLTKGLEPQEMKIADQRIRTMMPYTNTQLNQIFPWFCPMTCWFDSQVEEADEEKLIKDIKEQNRLLDEVIKQHGKKYEGTDFTCAAKKQYGLLRRSSHKGEESCHSSPCKDGDV